MKGIIYNQDANSLLYGVGKRGCKLTAEKMKNYASQFSGSHMTDIMLCLCNATASFPSKVLTSDMDKYYQKLENGIPVDHTEDLAIQGAHHVFETLGIDHIAIEIDTFREIGINPWISFRMNDFHDHHCETSPILPDYFHEHPEIQRAVYKPVEYRNNGDKNKNYALPFVRNLMLSFIEESLERYDPYGVELDYTREICVFSDGEELDGIEIMNEFVRNVHALCEKYGEKYGHEIKLAVRVAPTVEQNYDFGLNVMQWACEGLLDLVTVAGRFESNDTDMPIKLWSTLLKPYGVELAAGIEMNLLPHWGRRPCSPNLETFAACAASAYSQGADKIYMYNFFQPFDEEHITTAEPSFSPSIHGLPLKAAFYSTFGDFDKVLGLNRRYIITVNDRLPAWERNRHYAQLPTTFDRTRDFKIAIGEVPEGAKVQVRLGFGESTERTLEALPRVFLSGEQCTFVEAVEDDRFACEKVLCFDAPEGWSKSSAYLYIIADQKNIDAGEKTTVDYVEIYITAPGSADN